MLFRCLGGCIFGLIIIKYLLVSLRAVNPSPLFLIPGDGGSKLYAKLNRSFRPFHICKAQTDNYYLLWISPFAFLPIFDYCYHFNLKLRWDGSCPHNQTGVSIKTGPFGDPSSVEYLDDSYPFTKFTGYFAKLISHLTSPSSSLPYRRKSNLFGIPFDFRLGFSDFDGFFRELRLFVESSYKGVPVTLLAHSYGCLVTTYFLSKQGLPWRKKYIRQYISVSGPYAGSIISLKALLIGVNLDVHFHEDSVFRESLRTFPSTFALLPTWGSPVSVGGVNYSDYDSILKNLGGGDIDAMLKMWEMYKNVLPGLRVPRDVQLHCIISRGKSTIDKFRYATWKDYPDSPTLDYTDGDGTVRLASLRECAERHPWATVRQFDNLGHREILNDPRVIEYVDTILINSL